MELVDSKAKEWIFGMLASKENPLGCLKLTYEPGYSNREIWKMFWSYSLCKLGLDCEREEASV